MIHFVGFRFLKEIGEFEREGEANLWKTRKITKEEILAANFPARNPILVCGKGAKNWIKRGLGPDD